MKFHTNSFKIQKDGSLMVDSVYSMTPHQFALYKTQKLNLEALAPETLKEIRIMFNIGTSSSPYVFCQETDPSHKHTYECIHFNDPILGLVERLVGEIERQRGIIEKVRAVVK